MSNSYKRLAQRFSKFEHSVRYPESHLMFVFEAKQLVPTISFRLDQLFQRAIAAEKLGFNVVINADEAGMIISYRKKPDWSQT
jgi:hypothetical protein